MTTIGKARVGLRLPCNVPHHHLHEAAQNLLSARPFAPVATAKDPATLAPPIESTGDTRLGPPNVVRVLLLYHQSSRVRAPFLIPSNYQPGVELSFGFPFHMLRREHLERLQANPPLWVNAMQLAVIMPGLGDHLSQPTAHRPTFTVPLQ